MEPQAKQISKRGWLFEFDRTNSKFDVLTCVYVIIGNRKAFVVDTHCGPDSMDCVLKFLGENCPDHEVIVINSHYDWDHVWGNCAFESKLIIAHEKCYEKLSSDFIWDNMIQNSGSFQCGSVKKVLPNMVFSNVLHFPGEGVKLITTPGHTDCSISVWDQNDKVLFVGDNLEDPLPCLQWWELDKYLQTLDLYKSMEFDVLLASHNSVIKEELIQSNADYISKVANKIPLKFDNPSSQYMHDFNCRLSMASFYEEQGKRSKDFLLEKFWQLFEDNLESPFHDFERVMKNYTDEIK